MEITSDWERNAPSAVAAMCGIANAQLEMATWDRPLDPRELLAALERIVDEAYKVMPFLRAAEEVTGA